MERSRNTVRLLDTTKSPKERRSLDAESRPKTLKLAIRLLEGLNGPVRSLTQYRGDLSQIVVEAVEATDLSTAPLVDIRDVKVGETCVMLPESVLRTLKKTAKDRETSLNALVNTAVAHWLAAKKAIRLRK